MTTAYYTVTGVIDGETEQLFGSFQRADCTSELTEERRTWKEQGYKKLTVVATETADAPDAEVYAGETMTVKELWLAHAPDFNFELDAEQLLEKALDSGFAQPTNVEGRYLINTDYNN